MEPVGVRVCRETKQVSYKISYCFNFSAVVGNSLICISEGTAELKEGVEVGIEKQGLVPPCQVRVLFPSCYFRAEGCRAVSQTLVLTQEHGQLSTHCPSQFKGSGA